MSKVKIEWSPGFAYAIGLIATDGNLSIDGRHMNFASKDIELIETFKKCLLLDNRIGRKARGGEIDKKYFQVQFGDKNFYDFLLDLGLTPTKSRTIGKLEIPSDYFADFFRGCIDGDGSIGFFNHLESRHPQLRIRLVSAGNGFLEWIKGEISNLYGIKSGWIETKEKEISSLIYAKADSIKLFEIMYYKGVEYYLSRKYDVVKKFYGRVAELV
ncbi:MAG: hypothetical protein AAB787_02775 [Patescibacteria group bacterium]